MEETQEIQAVKKLLLSLFNDAKEGKMDGCSIPIGWLTESGKRYLSSISGLDFKEYTDFVLNASDLRHIYKEHYGTNEKDRGNNIPLTDEDIVNMIDVISAPEKIIFLGKNPIDGTNRFDFLKGSERGTYNLLEVYGQAGGRLTAKTFYKTKKGISQRVIEIEKSPQLSTSKTTGASLSLETKIPTMLVPMLSDNKGITSFSEKQENSQKVFQKAVRSAALEAVNKHTDAQRAQEETTKMPEQKRSLNL